jgi:carbazole 1,9a-dioxygenase terminal dioxygenase component
MALTEPAPTTVERQLADDTRGFVDRAEPKAPHRPWQRWIDAELGLRGYWYPVARSSDLVEGAPTAVKALGEEILLVRKGDKLFGVEDRCAHRGSRFSERPLVLSEDTVTCWYHTWTFDLGDGRIRCILNDPETVLKGKPGIRAYPVDEAKGLIFAFIGDGEAPPLEDDLPPGFLDPELTFHVAEPGLIQANWRLCLENAFDPGHHFIHNWSPMVVQSGFPMTFGYVAKKGEEHAQVQYKLTGPGPLGFTRCTKTSEFLFEATIPGRRGRPDTLYMAPGAAGRTKEELFDRFMSMPPITVGIWMPCANSIENFPFGGAHNFEWSVPIDETTTRYFKVGGKRCATEEDAEAWRGQQGYDEWAGPVIEGFMIDDNKARESMETFYATEDGWYRERLYRPDLEITMFRKFFSEHARGLQTSDSWRAAGRDHQTR